MMAAAKRWQHGQQYSRAPLRFQARSGERSWRAVQMQDDAWIDNDHRPHDSEHRLTVSDGAHSASIVLLGNDTAASIVLNTDGAGGTLVTDPPPPTGASPIELAPNHG
jgi:hypothetical protein